MAYKELDHMPSKEEMQAFAIAFCNRVEERGYYAVIYTNIDFWNRAFGELSNSTTTNDFTFVPSSDCFIDINYTYQLHGQEHSLWIRRSNVPNDRTFGVEDQ